MPLSCDDREYFSELLSDWIPDVPDDIRTSISADQIDEIARCIIISPHERRSNIYRFEQLNTKRLPQNHCIPPLYFLGYCRVWSEVILLIMTYIWMPRHLQLEYGKRSRRLGRQLTEMLHDNIKYLEANRPPLPDDPSIGTVTDSDASSIATCAESHTCSTCGYLPTEKILRRYHNLARHKFTDDSGECVSCIERAIQHYKYTKKNNNIDEVYTSQVEEKESCIVTESDVTVDLEKCLRDEFGSDASGISIADRLTPLFGKAKLLVREINTVDSAFYNKRDYIAQKRKLDGARWENTSVHPNTISHCPDGIYDLTFVHLSTPENIPYHNKGFLCIANSNFDQGDVSKFAEDEDKHIQAKTIGRRPGPASKVFDPNKESPFLSEATRKETTLLCSAGRHAVNMKCIYENANGIVKDTNWGYNSMEMHRLGKVKKREQARDSVAYRNILYREALVYIASVSCLEAMGIPSISNDEYFPLLHQMLFDNVNQPIEETLVSWMVKTGEIRNHQSVACHVDGNSSHLYEVYSLFQRHGMEKRNGYIYLPLSNLCVEIECNMQSMVCNFTNVPHVADETRDTYNFSKVQGPKT